MSTSRVLRFLRALGLFLAFSSAASCLVLLSAGPALRAHPLAQKLKANTDLSQHVGQVQDLQLEPPDDAAEDDVWIYHVQGTKWSGRLSVKHEPAADGGERILWARLELPSGEIVELDVEEIETDSDDE